MAEIRKAKIMLLDFGTKALSPRAIEILVGLSVGAIGGMLQSVLRPVPLAQSLLFGLVFGAAFAVFFAQRATTPGAGLIWGLAFAVLTWIVFPAGIVPLFAGASGPQSMLNDARERFPQLVSFLVCLGMPVGLSLGLWAELRSRVANPKFSWGRAIVAGGFAGTLGGLIFGRWVSSGDYFPLLAGYGALNISRSTIILLHFAVALLIGAHLACSSNATCAAMVPVWVGDWGTLFSGGFSANSLYFPWLHISRLIGRQIMLAPCLGPWSVTFFTD